MDGLGLKVKKEWLLNGYVFPSIRKIKRMFKHGGGGGFSFLAAIAALYVTMSVGR